MAKTNNHTLEIPDRMWELAKEITESDDPTRYLHGLFVEEVWNRMLNDNMVRVNTPEGCCIFVAPSSKICPECKGVLQKGTEIIAAHGKFMHIECCCDKLRATSA